MIKKHSEQLLVWAIEAEEQAKYEVDFRIIARLKEDSRYYLKEAAKLESKGE